MHAYMSDATNITTSDVNITVLFKRDRSPLVIVNVKVLILTASFINQLQYYNHKTFICTQLPHTICSYQHLNYSIIIEGDGKMVHQGPYQQYGSNPIRETIASVLEENREYTLRVIVATQASISYSQQNTFSK